MKAFFEWAVVFEYLSRNPFDKLDAIQVKQVPTLPLSKQDFQRLLDNVHAVQARDRTTLTCAILLMRWSGLAIIDASCLLKSRLLPGSNQLQTYRQKTEGFVSVTLPNFVADLLRMQSCEHPDYFFWDKNKRNRRSQVHWFETRLRKIYDKAGIRPRGAHRFRDTFAVEYLDNGGDMETLARFLGHSTSATTRLHYNPWDKSRQKVLDDDMRRSHIAQGIIEPKEKETRVQ